VIAPLVDYLWNDPGYKLFSTTLNNIHHALQTYLYQIELKLLTLCATVHTINHSSTVLLTCLNHKDFIIRMLYKHILLLITVVFYTFYFVSFTFHWLYKCMLNHGLEWDKWVLTNLSHSIGRSLTHLFLGHTSKPRPWLFSLLVTHGCTPVELRHGWLHSVYTTVDVTIEVGATSATVQ